MKKSRKPLKNNNNKTPYKKKKFELDLIELLGRDREFFQRVIEEIPAGIAIAEAPSGKIVLGNKHLEKIFRSPVIYSKNFGEYNKWKAFHPDGQPYKENEWPMARSIIKGEVVEGEDIVIERGDGTRGVINVRSAPIKDKNGKIVAGVVVDTEITESSILEQRRDDLVNIISHELKTPLTTLKIYIELINKLVRSEKSEAKGEIDKKLRRAESQIDRLNKIIEELVDITQLTEGKFQIKREVGNIEEVVAEAIEKITLESDKKRIVIKRTSIINVFVDRKRLAQAISCLLSNALKYSSKKDSVTLSVYSKESEVILMIKDKGIGIAGKYREKVYKRYSKARGKLENTFPGFGIGLYLSAEIIKMHNGRIWHDSKPGKGTTFYVALPILEENL